MGKMSLQVLGHIVVEVAGETKRLTPTGRAVLIRLLISNGRPVTVDQLFRDVWRFQPRDAVRRENRISVQKHISELRRILDPLHTGERSKTLLTVRGRISAYELALRREQVDMFRFKDLVEEARHADPDSAVLLLQSAMGLWRGRPLFDVEDHPFAQQALRELTSLHSYARERPLRSYRTDGVPIGAEQIRSRLLDEYLDVAPELECGLRSCPVSLLGLLEMVRSQCKLDGVTDS